MTANKCVVLTRPYVLWNKEKKKSFEKKKVGCQSKLFTSTPPSAQHPRQNLSYHPFQYVWDSCDLRRWSPHLFLGSMTSRLISLVRTNQLRFGEHFSNGLSQLIRFEVWSSPVLLARPPWKVFERFWDKNTNLEGKSFSREISISYRDEKLRKWGYRSVFL